MDRKIVIIDFPCPNCKRITLALKELNEENKRYCYCCGKTFTKKEIYEELKNGEQT